MTDTTDTRWTRHNEAGRAYFAQGDLARAEEAFVAAVREASTLGGDGLKLASSLSNLGQLRYRQRDFAQAEALFRRALYIREQALGADAYGVVQSINNLAALHYARGEMQQAEALFRRALTVSEQHLGVQHADLAVGLNNLAKLYIRLGSFNQAIPLLERLAAIRQQVHGGHHPEYASALVLLARALHAMGAHDAAFVHCEQALAIQESSLSVDAAVITPTRALFAEISTMRAAAPVSAAPAVVESSLDTVSQDIAEQYAGAEEEIMEQRTGAAFPLSHRPSEPVTPVPGGSPDWQILTPASETLNGDAHGGEPVEDASATLRVNTGSDELRDGIEHSAPPPEPPAVVFSEQAESAPEPNAPQLLTAAMVEFEEVESSAELPPTRLSTAEFAAPIPEKPVDAPQEPVVSPSAPEPPAAPDVWDSGPREMAGRSADVVPIYRPEELPLPSAATHPALVAGNRAGGERRSSQPDSQHVGTRHPDEDAPGDVHDGTDQDPLAVRRNAPALRPWPQRESRLRTVLLAAGVAMALLGGGWFVLLKDRPEANATPAVQRSAPLTEAAADVPVTDPQPGVARAAQSEPAAADISAGLMENPAADALQAGADDPRAPVGGDPSRGVRRDVSVTSGPEEVPALPTVNIQVDGVTRSIQNTKARVDSLGREISTGPLQFQRQRP
jgi:tetratricopeptide (TPR) repeat protein